MILDIHTLELLGDTIQCDILAYSNIGNPLKRFKKKKVTYFGFYDYQDFDVKELLKFSFEHFRDVGELANKVFLVSPFFNYNDIVLPEKYKEKEFFRKEPNKHYKNFQANFDTLLYFQGDKPDTNNRIIPECFFYKKKIDIISNGIHDSVIIRYNDILENGLDKYQLTTSDQLVKAFLE